MTWGLVGSTMMTVFCSMTFVSTVCCSELFSAPVPCAFTLIRWTASMTSDCWSRKALPSDVVHWMSSPSSFTTSGNATIDWMLGSQGCFPTASSRALSFRSLFFASHCWSWMISSG